MSQLRVLALHGGGYLGLATAAFLDDAERHFGSRFTDRFDLFCGTSTGAILALGLAAGRDARTLVDLYRRLGPRVFPKRVPVWRRLFRAAYDPSPLREALEDEFKDLTLGDIRKNGKFVLVPSFCLSNGRPRVFKTDHSESLSGHDRYRLVDVALASSAAPTYFPIHVVADPTSGEAEAFCDGGIFANDPALLGWAEATSHLGRSPQDVALLSVSTPRSFLGSWSVPKNLNLGPAHWATRVAALAIDGTSDAAHQALDRIARTTGTAYHRFALQNVAGKGRVPLELDDASEAATTTLIQIGTQAARTAVARQELGLYLEGGN